MIVYVADGHVQGLVSGVKIATVLEECTAEEKRFLRFLWSKGLNGNDIHKGMFPNYRWKWFSRKAVHNRVKKFSQGRLKVADGPRPVAELTETTQKIVLQVLTHG
jgi:hypothetical protein